jgi:hypothetical protein
MPAQKYELRLKIAGAFNHADSLLQLRSHWDMVDGKPSTYPPTAHTHDDRYFTETEVTSALAGKLDKSGGTMTGDLYVPSVKFTYPIQNFNPFSSYKIHDSIQTNMLAGKWKKLKVTWDGVENTNMARIITDQNYEQYNGDTPHGIDGDADHVLNIDFVTNGLYGANGITYAQGTVVFNFYSTPFPTAWSCRWKDKNGVWTVITLSKNGSTQLIGTIPSNALYLTNIELTLSTGTGAPYVTSNIKWAMCEAEYYGSRMSLNQGAYVSAVGGYMSGDLVSGAKIYALELHDNGARVYSANNKPTLTDLGALVETNQKLLFGSTTQYIRLAYADLRTKLFAQHSSGSEVELLSDANVTPLIKIGESFSTGDILGRKSIGNGALEKISWSEWRAMMLGETSETAYRGDRGKTAYDHSQASGNPHGATLDNIADGSTRKLADYVPTTRTIAGLQLNANITIASLTAALNEASTSLKGLMSSTDKTNLDTLVALLASSDGDSVVNTITEILAIFNSYPEGADLVTALNGKVDKVTGYGLSKNDFTDGWKTKLEGISTGAEVNPDLMSESEGTVGTFTAKRTINALTLKAIILAHSPAGSRPASDVYPWAKAENRPTYVKGDVGLANADNTADNAKYVLGLIEQRASTQTKIWTGTQSQYDAIGTKDSNTLYFIQA